MAPYIISPPSILGRSLQLNLTRRLILLLCKVDLECIKVNNALERVINKSPTTHGDWAPGVLTSQPFSSKIDEPETYTVAVNESDWYNLFYCTRETVLAQKRPIENSILDLNSCSPRNKYGIFVWNRLISHYKCVILYIITLYINTNFKIFVDRSGEIKLYDCCRVSRNKFNVIVPKPYLTVFREFYVFLARSFLNHLPTFLLRNIGSRIKIFEDTP